MLLQSCSLWLTVQSGSICFGWAKSFVTLFWRFHYSVLHDSHVRALSVGEGQCLHRMLIAEVQDVKIANCLVSIAVCICLRRQTQTWDYGGISGWYLPLNVSSRLRHILFEVRLSSLFRIYYIWGDEQVPFASESSSTLPVSFVWAFCVGSFQHCFLIDDYSVLLLVYSYGCLRTLLWYHAELSATAFTAM